MKDSAKIYFKDWLPDLPSLDNPGLLEVTNALPVDSTYKWAPSMAAGITSPSAATFLGASDDGAFLVHKVSATSGATDILVYTGGAPSATQAGYSGDSGRDFYEWDDGVYYMSGQPMRRFTEGSPTAVTVNGAPNCEVLDRIGNFLVVGGRSGSLNSSVRWSSIGDPEDWPTPLSSTAVARQSGEQEFPIVWGNTAEIIGGEEFGLVLQVNGAVHRMTYVGGNIVFQFNRIADNVGTVSRHSGIRAGNKYYFYTSAGFWVSDGWNVQNISDSKISQYLRTYGGTALVWPKLDPNKKLIYWPFGTGIAVFNFIENRWAWIDAATYALYTIGTSGTLGALRGAATYGSLSGAPVTATFTTGDFEPHVGGMSRIDGICPLVDVTTNALTVQIASRKSLGEAVSFNAAQTANSRNGFADFRVEGRYHRAKITVAGTFNAAQGFEPRLSITGKL